MAKDFSKGDAVEWSWGNGTATGTVEERFTSKVTRTIEGNEVTRNASEDEPAYMVSQEDGGRALKSGSELTASSGSSGSSPGSSPSGDDRTRDELYEEAKAQDVEGRSKMDKAELREAVDG